MFTAMIPRLPALGRSSYFSINSSSSAASWGLAIMIDLKKPSPQFGLKVTLNS